MVLPALVKIDNYSRVVLGFPFLLVSGSKRRAFLAKQNKKDQLRSYLRFVQVVSHTTYFIILEHVVLRTTRKRSRHVALAKGV